MPNCADCPWNCPFECPTPLPHDGYHVDYDDLLYEQFGDYDAFGPFTSRDKDLYVDPE